MDRAQLGRRVSKIGERGNLRQRTWICEISVELRRIAYEIIGRILLTLAPGEQFRSAGGEHRHDFLVTFGVALKNALQVHGVDVQTVQKRSIAVRRCARAGQENVIALRQYGAVTVGER